MYSLLQSGYYCHPSYFFEIIQSLLQRDKTLTLISSTVLSSLRCTICNLHAKYFSFLWLVRDHVVPLIFLSVTLGLLKILKVNMSEYNFLAKPAAQSFYCVKVFASTTTFGF